MSIYFFFFTFIALNAYYACYFLSSVLYLLVFVWVGGHLRVLLGFVCNWWRFLCRIVGNVVFSTWNSADKLNYLLNIFILADGFNKSMYHQLTTRVYKLPVKKMNGIFTLIFNRIPTVLIDWVKIVYISYGGVLYSVVSKSSQQNITFSIFPEMVDSMKNVAGMDVELTVEERNLLSVAYKNVIGARRASWRIISSIEQKEENKGGEDKLKMIREYRQTVRYVLTNAHLCN